MSSALSSIRADLDRLARYDDESIVHEEWVRQRYNGGYAATYQPARLEAVITAWHEAGHAVAALAAGARFSSASIRQGRSGQGRVHKIQGAGPGAFVIDAAGQIAERLRTWTLPSSSSELCSLLASWRSDGGDAARFRAAIRPRFGTDEVAAWECASAVVVPLRWQIRHLARALLVYPRFIRYDVAAALYQDANSVIESSTTSAPAS